MTDQSPPAARVDAIGREGSGRVMAEIAGSSLARDLSRIGLRVASDVGWLRALAIGAGLSWSLLFIVVALRFDLQMFGDGSIFSYSVAVEDGWLFHWHNISVRLAVYIYSHLPAEIYVRLTGDARGGIVAYGFLFFGAQLLGLAMTFAADRSKQRVIFTYACCSTAILCPLVLGAPTEMWMAHAAFWPALALCHYAAGRFAVPAIFSALLALVLTHEGALVLAAAIMATLFLRGPRDPALFRALRVLGVVLAIWLAIRLTFPPDDYITDVLEAAAFNFIDVSSLGADPFPVLFAAMAGYCATYVVLCRITPARAHVHAGLIVVAALAAHWLLSDKPVNGDNKYYLRTALLIFTPVFGALAAAYALDAEGRLSQPFRFLPAVLKGLANDAVVRAATGAILLGMLVHAVETGRFVIAWRNYEDAVRALAMSGASDPRLGDPRFILSDRIPARLDATEWPSTTPFLSVLVAPGFAPARLVVDPDASYFWLTCSMASASRNARRAIPAASRDLVRAHACLHRRP